jgi:hypothetical protein
MFPTPQRSNKTFKGVSIMSQENVYGSSGQVIGRLHKGGSTVNGERIDVYDGFNNYVGYVGDSGTYNDTGFRISINRMPGLLLKDGVSVASEQKVAFIP